MSCFMFLYVYCMCIYIAKLVNIDTLNCSTTYSAGTDGIMTLQHNRNREKTAEKYYCHRQWALLYSWWSVPVEYMTDSFKWLNRITGKHFNLDDSKKKSLDCYMMMLDCVFYSSCCLLKRKIGLRYIVSGKILKPLLILFAH